jgi:2-desacetyl-2-hydroxyethyl bacteriochlorophyllide A dehydrogenase
MAMVKTAGEIEFRDKQVPDPGEGEVLIKTKAVSICGSDVHTFHGTHPFAPLPAAVGHEMAGQVEDVGPGAVKFKPGDRVVLEPIIVCGECGFCQRGDYHLCIDVSFHHRRGNGALTPYFLANQDWVHRLPDNISYEEGALVEPLAVSAHAAKRTRIELGQSVAVFGAGTIGLLVLLLAKRGGAGDVFSVDIQGFRLHKALEFGATETFNNLEGDSVEAILSRTDGLGVDVAFEAVGEASTFNQVLRSLKKGGAGVVIGLFSELEVAIPPNIFVAREITLSGTQGYCRDFQTALKLVENGDIDLKRLITHTLPFEAVKEGFEVLDDPEAAKAIKVVITFD